MLTDAQYTTLKNAILADTDPAVVAARAAGADNAIKDLYNAAASPVVKAWRSSVDKDTLFSSMNITQFDGLTAGKRDSWRLVMDMAPVNATKAKIRSAVEDVWSTQTTTMNNILADLTRNATKAEALLGGTDATSGTVTAKKLDWEGLLTDADIARALRG